LFLIRRMEVEINSAQGALVLRLAEDDGDLFVEGDAVAEIGAAGFVGLDGLVHERDEGFFKTVGRFIDADDVFVVGLDGLGQLGLESFNSHGTNIPEKGRKLTPKCNYSAGLNFFRRPALLNAGAGAEERAAQPDDGRAFLDGDFVIAAHAHAEMRQGRAEDLFALFLQLAQLAEHGPHLFGVGRPWSDGHEAVDFDFAEGIDFGKVGEQLGGRVAELAGFAGDVYLDEDGHGFGGFAGPLVNFAGEVEAVHALDHFEEVDGVAAFVGLEMADHVPAQMAGALADFGPGFLHAVFAEESQAEAGGGAHGGRRLTFADGQERDGFGSATGSEAGGGDALADVLQIGGQIHETI
jgi:hypothetical protein